MQHTSITTFHAVLIEMTEESRCKNLVLYANCFPVLQGPTMGKRTGDTRRRWVLLGLNGVWPYHWLPLARRHDYDRSSLSLSPSSSSILYSSSHGHLSLLKRPLPDLIVCHPVCERHAVWKWFKVCASLCLVSRYKGSKHTPTYQVLICTLTGIEAQ